MNPKTLQTFKAVGLVIGSLVIGYLLGLLCRTPSAEVGPSSRGDVVISARQDPVVIPLPNGDSLTVPPNRTVRVHIVNDGDVDKTSTTFVRDTGSSLSAGAKAQGEKITENLNTETAALGLNDMFAKKTKTSYDLKALSANGGNVMLVFGCILVVAGLVVWIWVKQAGLGMALLISGGVLIGVSVLYEQYPWVIALGAVAAIGVAAVIVGNAYAKSRSDAAGIAAVKGIEALKTIEPKDLPMTIEAPETDATIADQTAFAQQVINATYEALKTKLTATSEASGGVLASLIAKFNLK